MLKFFRKIRQNLLAENRLSKYLFYAIGEVVLVVIGILIAVTINNLNETSKANKIDALLLHEIKQNLENDLAAIEEEIAAFDKYYRSQLYLIQWLESDLPFPDSLSLHVNSSYYRGYFKPNRIAYETLKQDGINPEEDNELKLDVARLYDIIYTQHIYFLEFYQEESYALYQACLMHFNELGFYNKSTKPIDPEQLKSDSHFLTKLKTLKNLNKYTRRTIMEITKKEIIQTLSSFEKKD